MLSLTQTEKGIVFRILVQPRASRRGIAGVQDGMLRVRITSPPVEGRGNEEVIRLLADALKVGRDRVTILSGQKGRRKTVAVAGVSATDLHALIPGDGRAHGQ
jgi:uncharacterized protein